MYLKLTLCHSGGLWETQHLLYASGGSLTQVDPSIPSTQLRSSQTNELPCGGLKLVYTSESGLWGGPDIHYVSWTVPACGPQDLPWDLPVTPKA